MFFGTKTHKTGKRGKKGRKVYFPGPCSLDLITLHHKRARKREKKRFCYLKATNLSEEVPIRVKKACFWPYNLAFWWTKAHGKAVFFWKNGEISKKTRDDTFGRKKSDFWANFSLNLGQKTAKKCKKTVFFRIFVSWPKISTYIEGKTWGLGKFLK